eukprot:m.95831 g.95831  ORF g.95831 m.95831 type:complete len:83 (+) comp26848_c0_seq10:1624-1872(+)
MCRCSRRCCDNIMLCVVSHHSFVTVALSIASPPHPTWWCACVCKWTVAVPKHQQQLNVTVALTLLSPFPTIISEVVPTPALS